MAHSLAVSTEEGRELHQEGLLALLHEFSGVGFLCPYHSRGFFLKGEYKGVIFFRGYRGRFFLGESKGGCICIHLHAFGFICIHLHASASICIHLHAFACICIVFGRLPPSGLCSHDSLVPDVLCLGGIAVHNRAYERECHVGDGREVADATRSGIGYDGVVDLKASLCGEGAQGISPGRMKHETSHCCQGRNIRRYTSQTPLRSGRRHTCSLRVRSSSGSSSAHRTDAREGPSSRYIAHATCRTGAAG